MKLLSLFLAFFKIGAVSFGGGYGMISIIRETVLSNGWLSEAELLNFIAVAESTPGPIAVNMATFIGSSQAGILGSASATLGVVLPSFIIILVIAALIHNLLKYRPVNAFLGGVRPCVVGMILATGITVGLTTLFSLDLAKGVFAPDIMGCVILVILFTADILWRKFRHKKPSPILMIVASALLGLVFYS